MRSSASSEESAGGGAPRVDAHRDLERTPEHVRERAPHHGDIRAQDFALDRVGNR